MIESIWTTYKVQWIFLTKLCASVPNKPISINDWLKGRQPKAIPAGAKSINEIQEEVLATIAEGEEEFTSLVFQRVGGQLVMRAGTVRAHLKDCARVMSSLFIGKIEGERAFSSRVINGVYPDPAQHWIPILRPEGDVVTQADGDFTKAVHSRHPRTGAPQNSLKQFEYIEPARMDFNLKVLGSQGKKNPAVKLQDLEILMQYGGVHGYAGERSDGEGNYLATIEEVI
jgi:hypothetical protein